MRSLLALLVLAGCGGSLTIDEYPAALRDAYCKYETRCGAFPDISTCEHANIGLPTTIDVSLKEAIDKGKATFDGGLAQDCLDAFGAQTCDTTDEDSRSFALAKCRTIVKGTVGSGGACALGAECKSGTCTIPTCPDACCQGTCMGDAPPPLGGSGAACTSSSMCAAGFFCDFTNQVCAELKPAGATCNSTTECAYNLGCAGTTTRTCKTLPKLGEPCPDGVCRDAGNYCNGASQCAKIGLEGEACAQASGQCSPFYPCDTTTNKCTKAPSLGQVCTARCFDEDTFCDTGSAAPTCIATRPDGQTCAVSSQCQSNHCDQGSGAGSGTCSTPAACI